MNEIKDEKEHTESAVNAIISGQQLFGVVDWINGNPILDGIEAYISRDEALEKARDKINMCKNSGVNHRITVIDIRVAH